MGLGMFSLNVIMNELIKGYNSACVDLVFSPTKCQRICLGLFGVVLIASISPHDAYAGAGSFGVACNKMLLLIEGAFGALVAAVAGVAAVVAAALGGFKMAWSLVVVSIGAFILRSWIQLFQGSCGCPTC
jgi:hypothetical protein